MQIIVIGVSGGGTSAIAASLNALGIPLGRRFHHPIYEDIQLAELFRNERWRDFANTVREYENWLGDFAWKLPDACKHLDRVQKSFPSPRFIFVYRDLFAVASGGGQGSGRDISAGMKAALADYRRIQRFIHKHSPDALHVSYEKLLRDPNAYARQLAEFCGITISDEQRNAIIRSVDPVSSGYDAWTTAQQQRHALNQAGFNGSIDSVNESGITGWLLKIGDDKPVTAEILLDGVVIAEVQCDSHRQDVIDSGYSRNGIVGFYWGEFNDRIQPESIVAVRPKGSASELTFRMISSV